MWEIIPPVQLKPSTIDAKARLSFSGGSEWPRAQLRHYWCAPGFLAAPLLQTFAHLSPYLPPPSSLHLPPGRCQFFLFFFSRGSGLCPFCVCVCLSAVYSESEWIACINSPWAARKCVRSCRNCGVSVHLYKAAFLPRRMGSGEDGSPAMWPFTFLFTQGSTWSRRFPSLPFPRTPVPKRSQKVHF